MKRALWVGHVSVALSLFVLASTVGSQAKEFDHQGHKQFGIFFVDPIEPDVIYLDGDIADLSPLHFRDAVRAFPAADTLVLNSRGGLVTPALLIADEAHDRRFSTLIPSDAVCYSACAFIFFGGAARNANGQLGVHQFAADQRDQVGDLLTVADILELLTRFDAPVEVITTLLRTPPDEMHIFSATEINRLGINFGQVAAPRLARLPELPQDDRQLFRDMMAEMATDQTLLRSFVEGFYGVVPEKMLGPAVHYMTQLYATPAFADYIFDGLSAEAIRGELTDDEAFAISFALAQNVPLAGLPRLSTSEQAEFLVDEI